MGTTRDARYWTDKALRAFDAAHTLRANGDDARAEMAEEAYRVAAREAVARGARCFTAQEVRL